MLRAFGPRNDGVKERIAMTGEGAVIARRPQADAAIWRLNLI